MYGIILLHKKIPDHEKHHHIMLCILTSLIEQYSNDISHCNIIPIKTDELIGIINKLFLIFKYLLQFIYSIN